MQTLMVSLRGRGYMRLCLIGWAPEGCECQGCESASAQRAARSHTDAVLQRGIKTPATAPLPRLLQVRQRQCKMFQKISMCTSAVWRESGLNVSLCAVAMPRGFRHLQSQPHISSHAHPALPLSAHKRLCLDLTEHCAQLGLSCA